MRIIEKKFRVICLEGNQPNGLLKEALKLRYQVFKEELGWVSGSEDGFEKDEYDAWAIHFILVNKNDGMVVGYARLIPPGNSFMFDGPFRKLITDSDTKILQSLKAKSAEISRLAVRKEFRGGKQGLSLNMLLFRAMYRWSIDRGIRYWYMATVPGLYVLLKRFFPCVAVGAPTKLSPDTVSLAIRIDLDKAREKLHTERPKLLEWFLYRINLSRVD